MIYNGHRPAIFQYVGLTQPDMKIAILFDLPYHRGFPEQKFHIPIDAPLPYATYSGPQNHHHGIILLGLSDQLQWASKSAGISLSIRDAQALLYDLDRVMCPCVAMTT